jgi:lyso-ornithine lipid O-acyltransferase
MNRPVRDAFPLRTARLLWRLVKFALVTAGAILDGLLGRCRRGFQPELWVHRWGSWYGRALNWHFTVTGTPPRSGLLVSNHVSYVDIVMLGAVSPTVFVAKAEVRGWPVFGWLARLGGTLFITRTRRLDVARVNDEMQDGIAAGRVATVFPEGTSSGGDTVLPFHASLLGSAAEGGWLVTPVWIGYTLADGDPASEICYFGDMVLLPHLLNLLTKREVRACVRYGPARTAGPDRKALARELHAAVLALREEGVEPVKG